MITLEINNYEQLEEIANDFNLRTFDYLNTILDSDKSSDIIILNKVESNFKLLFDEKFEFIDEHHRNLILSSLVKRVEIRYWFYYCDKDEFINQNWMNSRMRSKMQDRILQEAITLLKDDDAVMEIQNEANDGGICDYSMNGDYLYYTYINPNG